MAKRPINNRPMGSPLFGRIAPQNQNWKNEYSQIVSLQGSGQDELMLTKALSLYQKFPTTMEVQNLAATLLAQAHRETEAIEIWDKIKNKNAVIFNNIANARLELGLLDEKTEHYFQQALKLNPNYEDALFNYGILKHRTYDNTFALEIYRKLAKLAPKYPSAMTNLLFSLYYTNPLPLNELLECSKKFAQVCQNQLTIPAAKKATNSEKPLKIGIICADLRQHPVGYFFESLISAKASRQFQWVVYANTAKHDQTSESLSKYCESWYKNVNTWSDLQIIEQIHEDNIDILLDLTGYSGHHRMSVFTQQITPLQMTWLGFWGTTGIKTMQAIIADPYCVHEGEEKWFTEKVYRLPHSRLCMTPPKADIKPNQLPVLQKGHITFGCFQNLLKVNDDVLRLWKKIAQQLPEAKWIFQNKDLEPSKQELEIFRTRLLNFGFNENQFKLVGKVSRDEYFKSYHDVDFILDVFPYTGGTTTTEALWMGVPTITLTSEGMIARQGEQLLSVAGLPDWVCQTEDEYIEKALYWANSANFSKLNELRQKLRQQVLTSPLFDTEKFAEDWCKLVRQIWIDECQKNQNS